MKRLLAAVALLTLLAAPVARAQSTGFTRADWTDPAPSADRAGTPLAYLDEARPLTGVVAHENGVSRVTALYVIDPANPPSDGCQPVVDPNAALEGDGTFHVNATFPCNQVYEIRANAESNPGSGIGSRPAETRAMPLLVAVAIPPAPVAQVNAEVEVDGDQRTVTLDWPGNDEADLLGYVVTRDGESLGQVNAGDATRFTDTDPPASGGDVSYEVTAYRQGPDDEVKQVPSRATAVSVEVPADPDAPAEAVDADGDGQPDGGEGGEPVDPQIAGEQHTATESGRPLSISSGRAASQRPPSLGGPPTTLDTGFQETLPFDTSGGEAAAAPTGDPAVVATFETEDVLDEKQRLAFIAGGLAVLVGAAVILYVTRRAAREAY